MIRTFESRDIDDIGDILQKGDAFDENYLSKDFVWSDNVIAVYENRGIKAYYLLHLNSEAEKEWRIDLYVEPDSRGKGIGTMLYSDAENYVCRKDGHISSGRFLREADGDYEDRFFENRGFNRWWQYDDMIYKGSGFERVGLRLINYSDEYYDQYADLLSRSFYKTRMENDIKPYNYCEKTIENRIMASINKDDIFVLLTKGGSLVSCVTIDGYTIGNIAVGQKYRGLGYGRETVKFAVNKVMERGAQTVRLSVMENNYSAKGLYESLGFEVDKKVQVIKRIRYIDW